MHDQNGQWHGYLKRRDAGLENMQGNKQMSGHVVAFDVKVYDRLQTGEEWLHLCWGTTEAVEQTTRGTSKHDRRGRCPIAGSQSCLMSRHTGFLQGLGRLFLVELGCRMLPLSYMTDPAALTSQGRDQIRRDAVS